MLPPNQKKTVLCATPKNKAIFRALCYYQTKIFSLPGCKENTTRNARGKNILFKCNCKCKRKSKCRCVSAGTASKERRWEIVFTIDRAMTLCRSAALIPSQVQPRGHLFRIVQAARRRDQQATRPICQMQERQSSIPLRPIVR